MKRIWQSLLLVLWALAATPAHAALHDVVVLTNAKAATRDEARTQAINVAKGMAVARVARKLNPGKAQEYLRTLDLKAMQPLIRGATVVEETRIDDVYYAKVRITIIDTPIREAYGEKIEDDEAQVEKPRRAIMVLPVFFNGVEPVVWDTKGNPTYDMWREAGYTIGHGALLIPGGEPKERAIVDRDNVLTVPYPYIKPMLDGYGADEVAIAVVSDATGAAPTDPVDVVIRRVRENGQRVERFQLEPNTTQKGAPEPRKELYRRAVRQAAELLTRATESTAYLEQRAKRAAKQQTVQVQFTTLRDWTQIEKALRAVPGFVAMDTLSIGINNASLILYVTEDVEAARAALMKEGLHVPLVDGVWRVRSR